VKQRPVFVIAYSPSDVAAMTLAQGVTAAEIVLGGAGHRSQRYLRTARGFQEWLADVVAGAR
jgi:hypothetical protein